MKKLNKKIGLTAAALGALTIGIGAFGAHGLEQLVNGDALKSFETGVRYQMYHVIALLVLAYIPLISPSTRLWVFRFFLVGILLFSGSIYLLALKDLWSFDVGFLGPITPVGGLSFIMGWLRLAYGLYSLKSE